MARRSARTRSPATRKALGWDSAPFEVPADILTLARCGQALGRQPQRVGEAPCRSRGDNAREFERRMSGDLPASFDATIDAYKQKLAADKPKVATRKSSEMALEVINGALAEDARRFGRPDRLQQHQDQPDQGAFADRLRQPLRPLRHPRTRHGGGDERHGAAWRADPLLRHLPLLLRLCAAGHAARLADGHPRRSSS